MSATRQGRGHPVLRALAALGGILVVGLGAAVVELLSGFTATGGCAATAAADTGTDAAVALGPQGTGLTVGATEYGGPADPSSGTVGASGANLIRQPDSYAELGGTSFATAVAMGGLPYGTPLRITWGSRSAIAYKRDIGLGGGPIDGYPRVIDLWWQLASRLGIPYLHGSWAGPVRIERTPPTGAAQQLGELPSSATAGGPIGSAQLGGACGVPAGAAPTTAPGSRAVLLANGMAAAPADAPQAVRAMIAAGNQIVGKPYVYGGGHGLPLSEIAPAYDCSSSVDHLLYGAGLLSGSETLTSGQLESFGAPGPGRWVTLYASGSHVFTYVAGLRWDTHNAAGPADGSAGIGWHPLVRDATGFVARHPLGL